MAEEKRRSQVKIETAGGQVKFGEMLCTMDKDGKHVRLTAPDGTEIQKLKLTQSVQEESDESSDGSADPVKNGGFLELRRKSKLEGIPSGGFAIDTGDYSDTDQQQEFFVKAPKRHF